jgi:hypothetical protein
VSNSGSSPETSSGRCTAGHPVPTSTTCRFSTRHRRRQLQEEVQCVRAEQRDPAQVDQQAGERGFLELAVEVVAPPGGRPGVDVTAEPHEECARRRLLDLEHGQGAELVRPDHRAPPEIDVGAVGTGAPQCTVSPTW